MATREQEEQTPSLLIQTSSLLHQVEQMNMTAEHIYRKHLL